MTEAILYGYWRSSATYRVRIALNLKGVAYEARGVNLLKAEHAGAEHLALHPSGRVPILEIDGIRIGQSMAMIEYLDETRPEPPLLPQDPRARALVRDLRDQIVADIHPLNNLSALALLRAQFIANDTQIGDWYRHWIVRGFEVLEQMLPAEGGFCVGDAATLADIALVPQVANSRRYAIDLAPYPKLARIDAALRELTAFRDAAPENQPEGKQ
ncbi:MAG: maleylacetoacetate isomerase [Alphaproteobacteria bacterium]|nr:maleylacetoacetate isomerase [Alphaproteobacteria bacterium]